MPAELTQAIPVIATDAPAARHRRPCIPPSPLHVAGDADLTAPTAIRARAVGAEAYRREVDALAVVAALNPEAPHLDEMVLAVSEMLDGDGLARLHKAREIVTVVTLIADRADLDKQAGRRLTIRAAMVRALTMGAVDPVRVFEIVDKVLADEIAAGRL